LRNYLDESSIANLFREQITRLSLYIINDSTTELFTEACVRILAICKKLAHFDFKDYSYNDCARLSLYKLPKSAGFSSTLVHLAVNVPTFNDCISLLDGRLNHLTEFIVDIDYIGPSLLNMDNTVSKSCSK
jgi:hypothetical protein